MSKRFFMVLLLLMAFALSVAGPGVAKNYPHPVDRQDTDHPWGGDDSSSPDDPLNAGPVSPSDPKPTLVFAGGTKGGILVSMAEFVWSGFERLVFYIGPDARTAGDRTTATATTLDQSQNSLPGATGGKDGR